ncbi:MAG: hypothetical protein JXB04_05125 [Kiritimatiellae bacterium]|nr:hypothetical protein [Kiritimatiellia bacterium]
MTRYYISADGRLGEDAAAHWSAGPAPVYTRQRSPAPARTRARGSRHRGVNGAMTPRQGLIVAASAVAILTCLLLPVIRLRAADRTAGTPSPAQRVLVCGECGAKYAAPDAETVTAVLRDLRPLGGGAYRAICARCGNKAQFNMEYQDAPSP